MHPTITALFMAMPALALKNRIFFELGESSCQKCLHDVEATCNGPITSTEYNNCFCVPSSKAWSTLKDCITNKDTQCDEVKSTLLQTYGSHCFNWKPDEEEEICVPASQEDELLLSIADDFCTEFITPSGTASATASKSSGTSQKTSSATVTDLTAGSSTETETATSESSSEAASTDAPPSSATTPAPSSSDGADTTDTSSTAAATSTNAAGSVNHNVAGIALVVAAALM